MKNLNLLSKQDRRQVLDQALDQANPSRVIDRVAEVHDWNSNPRRYTKQITGFAKNEILLDCWNQYLAWMEAIEKGFNPSHKGHEIFYDMTPLELVEDFQAYLSGWLEGYRSAVENDNKKEDE